jgi:glutaredoxin
MKTTNILIAACLLAGAVPASADIYRWTDANGRVHFSDQSPGEGVKAQQMPMRPQPDRPEAAKMREAIRKSPVTLYLSNCGEPCVLASELLKGRGIPYASKEVDKDADAARELRQITGGQLQVPTLKIGENTQKGFEKTSWNNMLDLAGYPAVKPTPTRDPGAAPAKPGN